MGSDLAIQLFIFPLNFFNRSAHRVKLGSHHPSFGGIISPNKLLNYLALTCVPIYPSVVNTKSNKILLILFSYII